MKEIIHLRIGALFMAMAVIAGCSSSGPAKVSGAGTTLPDGLQYWDLKAGTGDAAVPGRSVTVNYTGWLTDGTKFDSSLDQRHPLSFILGTGQVIRGWDEGVTGMKVGGKRQLRIPAKLGYGTHSAGSIPPDSTLIFDVELLDVK